ncbi:flavoprotein [Streptomyces kaniharaensis]|uniref:Flavoprotein n=1 Tax=Streptomyces kaniharaensis TaxID=212423 RepID=A0A6N7KQH8_9ACTN|nr:flavoprotein [Streptomyces kaniharaensis]MQS12995.1 flavoprotein [Streptomyces kaniharaensis]
MADPVTGAAPRTAPPLATRRLLLVGTGSLGVASLPFWLNWLRLEHPDVDTKVVLTRTAERFVSRVTLSPILGKPVLQDAWPQEPETTALHVDLAQWAEGVVVYPASFHFIARLALGLADTPVMLALHCTRSPIVLAPALPPGGAESPAYLRHLNALERRPNIAVLPPQSGYSVTTGRMDASTAAPLPDALAALDRLASG